MFPNWERLQQWRWAVRIISRKRLREFAERHPDAKRPLDDWYNVVRRVEWESPHDVKATFGNASIVGDVVVFNIAGNKYRLSTNIRYRYRVVYIRSVMTHEEYDEAAL